MAEVTNELVYEILKSIQSEVSGTKYKFSEINNRLDSLTSQVRGLSMEVNAAHSDIANMYKTLERMDGRIMRIEKRLDIIEEPAE